MCPAKGDLISYRTNFIKADFTREANGEIEIRTDNSMCRPVQTG